MSKSICIISHVNPFSKGSGQVQRVYNTVLALASQFSNITLYTINEEKTSFDRVENVLNINKDFKIQYLKYKISPIEKVIFKILPYFGWGKESNFIIPRIFNKIEKEVIEKFDIVLIEYWYLYKLARKFKNAGLYVVCDTHNILYNSYSEFINKKNLPTFYKKNLLKKYYHLEFEKALKNNFDLLLSINLEEDKIYKQKLTNQEVYYMPMGVSLPEYNYKEKSITEKGKFTVAYYGGLGSSRNTIDALEVVNGFLACDKLNLHLKIIGSKPPKILQEYANQHHNIELTGFVDNLEEAFENVDLAIIPFKGKYGFRSRLIELMHYRVPVLTTSDAIWGMPFTDKEDIFIYNKDFTEYLEILIKIPEIRNKIALKAKYKVSENFTFEATYLKFANYLKDK